MLDFSPFDSICILYWRTVKAGSIMWLALLLSTIDLHFITWESVHLLHSGIILFLCKWKSMIIWSIYALHAHINTKSQTLKQDIITYSISILWCNKYSASSSSVFISHVFFHMTRRRLVLIIQGARWKNLRWQMPQDRTVIKKSITVWVMDILIRAGML